MADDIADLTAISVGDCSGTEHEAHLARVHRLAQAGR